MKELLVSEKVSEELEAYLRCRNISADEFIKEALSLFTQPLSPEKIVSLIRSLDYNGIEQLIHILETDHEGDE